MATLIPIPITSVGVDVTTLDNDAAVGGDVYDNSTLPYIEIDNGGVGSITVSVAAYYDGQTNVVGRSWTVGAGVRLRITPRSAPYVNPANNEVSLTYSGVTSVSIGLFY